MFVLFLSCAPFQIWKKVSGDFYTVWKLLIFASQSLDDPLQKRCLRNNTSSNTLAPYGRRVSERSIGSNSRNHSEWRRSEEVKRRSLPQSPAETFLCVPTDHKEKRRSEGIMLILPAMCCLSLCGGAVLLLTQIYVQIQQHQSSAICTLFQPAANITQCPSLISGTCVQLHSCKGA